MPDWNGRERSLHIRLDDEGDAVVTDALACRGLAARTFRRWRRKTEIERRHAAQRMIRDTVPIASGVSWRTDQDVSQNHPSFTVTFKYRVPCLAHVRDTIASLRLPWLDCRARVVGRDRRAFPLFWQTPLRHRTEIGVSTPANISWTFLPEPVRCGVGDDVRLRVKRTEGAEKASVDVVYERSAIDLSADQYSALRRCLRKRARIGEAVWQARP